MSLLARLRGYFTAGRGLLVGLSEETLRADPLELFSRWFADARKAGLYLPEAMTLASTTSDGAPSARMMLLKGFDQRGFRFFTNYESRKAGELDRNGRAAMVFHWAVLHRQVRVEGRTERMSKEESQEYFRTRPRGSQIGAWASKQSSVLEARTELDAQFRELERRFAGSTVPLPPFWGGYRLIPEVIEFWQGRANRLHDRIRFQRSESGWEVVRLSP